MYLRSMLFEIGQFEQSFDEKTLARGFRLFDRTAIELTGKPGDTDLRFAGKGVELQLRKKGSSLIAYNCSCGKAAYCEHLCAALFIIQKEALNDIGRKKASRTITPGYVTAIKKYTPEEFFPLHGKTRKEIKSPLLKNILAATNEDHCFETYLLLASKLLSAYRTSIKLDQRQIDEAHDQLLRLEAAIRNLNPPFSGLYYFHLAVVCELQQFLQRRFSGNETILFELKSNCLEALDHHFRKGLAPKEKAAWQSALLRCLRNNTVARTADYTFLLPRFLSWSQSKPALAEIRNLLVKRKNTVPFHKRFNPVTVGLFQVALREEAVFRVKPVKPEPAALMNYYMARIELAFCAGKTKKGFRLLESGYEVLLDGHRLYFEEYIAYALSQARRCKFPGTEARLLKERLVKGLHSTPEELKRWMELIPKKENRHEIDSLIEEIRQPKNYAFDKLSMIFLATERLEELMEELKKHPGAFRLTHEVAVKKLPAADKKTLDVYSEKFLSAIAEIKLYQHQQSLFETARSYFDRLSRESRVYLLEKIMIHSGSESQLSKYIRSVYGDKDFSPRA